jgi:hypothetical protein
MPPVTEISVAGTELEKVLTKVTTVFEREDKFYSSIKKRNVEKISNRQMRVPLELRPGGTFGYFNPNGGDLGRGGGPQFDKAVLNSVFTKIGIEYTKLTQWATDDARKAVINGVRRLTASAIVELRRQLDAQLQQPGTGVIGTIGVVTTAAGVDTYTLHSDGHGVRLVRFGQTVQVFDSTLATNRGAGVITFLDNTLGTKQIQVTPAIAGATATDVLVTEGITAPASLPALYGVPYHHSNASTGTWLGFSRSATPEIRANRVNAGGSPLTLPFPRLAINAIGNRTGEDNSFNPVAWLHPAQAQAYEEIGQLMSTIQIPKNSGSEGSLDLYFGNNMQLAGAPIRRTYNWDTTRIDFIVDSVWGRGEILPIGFYTVDGRKIFELRGASGGVATSDVFYMTTGFQTFVMNPAACAYIDNLAVPSGY